ncbi:hypothetical protein ACFFK0_27325 [Paenibacillus chartarius]|uniref:Uncharacterized protein n=1 Tax=Paenibacillus chartarius TaxID=747481 RepID=A0ABV6DTY1_9BACL
MSAKMVRTTIIAILTAVLISVWLLWLRLEPSVSPDDVSLRGKLAPIASVPDVKPLNGETQVAELTVNRLSAGTTSPAGIDSWYIYVPGTQSTQTRVLEEPQSDVLKPAASDAAALTQEVQTMLQQIGVSVTAGELAEPFMQYTGARGSYTAQALLKPHPNAAVQPAAKQEAYAIYIHRERKWGRDVSWTKAVKLES